MCDFQGNRIFLVLRWGAGSLSLYDHFIEHFILSRTRIKREATATTDVLPMSTKSGRVLLELHTIAAGSRWNKQALKTSFYQDLIPEVLRDMACWDEKLTLDLFDHLFQNQFLPRDN